MDKQCEPLSFSLYLWTDSLKYDSRTYKYFILKVQVHTFVRRNRLAFSNITVLVFAEVITFWIHKGWYKANRDQLNIKGLKTGCERKSLESHGLRVGSSGVYTFAKVALSHCPIIESLLYIYVSARHGAAAITFCLLVKVANERNRVIAKKMGSSDVSVESHGQILLAREIMGPAQIERYRGVGAAIKGCCK